MTARPWRVRRNGEATEERVDNGVAEMVLLGGSNIRVVAALDAGEVVDAVFAGRALPAGTTITARVVGHTWSLTYEEA